MVLFVGRLCVGRTIVRREDDYDKASRGRTGATNMVGISRAEKVGISRAEKTTWLIWFVLSTRSG